MILINQILIKVNRKSRKTVRKKILTMQNISLLEINPLLLT